MKDSTIVCNDATIRTNENSHIKSYIDSLMKENKGYLPKSTTCCWCLREDSPDYCLVQYFVDIDNGYAFDLSSSLLSGKRSVGATFQSSLFRHCTTVPIWIDIHGKYHMKGPKTMYNFAWGSDGPP